MNKGADISECGTYRYRLWRFWSDGPKVTWIMLNPSTADAEVDDPTIRRCVGFTTLWAENRGGYCELGGIDVVNLYALRATYPKELDAHPDPIGPENNHHVRSAMDESTLCIAAWGCRKTGYPDNFGARVNAVHQIALDLGATMYCLGIAKDGSPRHPLYLPYDAPFTPWSRPCD